MLRSKVKITDLQSGREYLLLVTKLNTKGLLVESSHTLQPGTPLRISLQLDDSKGVLDMRGEAHKIATRPDGSKGMVIRFVDPPSTATTRIEAFLKKLELEIQSASKSKKEATSLLSSEKTMMVATDTLSALQDAASENMNFQPLPSTVDEEELVRGNAGLGGATRIASSKEFGKSTFKKKGSGKLAKRLMQVALFAIFILAFLLFGDRLRKLFVTEADRAPVAVPSSTQADAPGTIAPSGPTIADLEKNPSIAQQVEAKPTAPSSNSSPSSTAAKPILDQTGDKSLATRTTSLKATLTNIEVQDEKAFVRITLKGNAEIGQPETSQASSPKRLIFDFKNIEKFTTPDQIGITKNPVLRLRVSEKDGGARLIVDLYPVPFPKYDIKTGANETTIFIRKS